VNHNLWLYSLGSTDLTEETLEYISTNNLYINRFGELCPIDESDDLDSCNSEGVHTPLYAGSDSDSDQIAPFEMDEVNINMNQHGADIHHEQENENLSQVPPEDSQN
jgi:hypothetical protein